LFAEVLPDELVEEIRIHYRSTRCVDDRFRFRSWDEVMTVRFATVRLIGRLPGCSNCAGTLAVASAFNVSPIAMATRLEELGLIE